MAAPVISRPRTPEPESRALAPSQWPWVQVSLLLVPIVLFIVAGPRRSTPIGVPALGILFIALAAIITFVNYLSTSPSRRAEWSLLAIMAITFGVPVARLPHNRIVLYLDVIALVILVLSAFLCRTEFKVPRGTLLMSTLFLALFMATALAPDHGGLKQLMLTAVPALPAFLLTGRLSVEGRHRVSMAVVALALMESGIAAVEAVFLKSHIWVSNFTQAATGIAQASQAQEEIIQPNKLFGVTLARAQGTFAHPLPLGLLLLVGLALVLRVIDVERKHKVWMCVVIGIGLLFTGDRNCLIIAAVMLAFLSARRLSGVRATIGAAVLGGGALLVFATSIVTSGTIQKFLDSGSYTHRLGAYQAIPKLLFDQAPLSVLFGNGVASTRRIFEAGLLQTDNLQVIDNQYVATLTHSGLVGLTALVVLTVMVFIHAPSTLRPAVLAAVVTLLIFDTLLWPAATVLTMFVFGSALSRAGSEPPPEDPHERASRVHPAFRPLSS